MACDEETLRNTRALISMLQDRATSLEQRASGGDVVAIKMAEQAVLLADEVQHLRTEVDDLRKAVLALANRSGFPPPSRN